MKKLLIWGAGDQGIVTLDCALAMKQYSQIDFLAFKEKGHRQIAGYFIYEEAKENLSSFFKPYDEVMVATGDNHLREIKNSVLTSMGIPLATIVHPTAAISPAARVSSGCTILAYAVINVNAVVGTGCIINTHADIEHDCIVEEYVNVCPKAAIAGHTKIGRKSFLGIGCSVIDEITVGCEVIVGAGAAVIKDVPDHVVVVGVPAKIKNSGIIKNQTKHYP